MKTQKLHELLAPKNRKVNSLPLLSVFVSMLRKSYIKFAGVTRMGFFWRNQDSHPHDKIKINDILTETIDVVVYKNMVN